MEFDVEVTRSVRTMVTVDAETAQAAINLVDKRDFELPGAEEWEVLKGSYELAIYDDDGEVVAGNERA